MISPNAETIESAAGSLQKIYNDTDKPVEYPGLREFTFLSELKELDSAIGQDLVSKLKALPFPVSPTDLPHAFRCGYLLGLQTARLCLMQNPKLLKAKVKPDDVL